MARESASKRRERLRKIREQRSARTTTPRRQTRQSKRRELLRSLRRRGSETAAAKEKRLFPETEAQARKRLAQEDKDRAQLKKDRARGGLAIKQGGGRTGAAYVGTGRPTTKPKAAGTKPVQSKKPKTDNRPTTVKEIEGVKAFIAAHKDKKGAMQNAVRQARARLERLKKKRAKEVKGNRPTAA